MNLSEKKAAVIKKTYEILAKADELYNVIFDINSVIIRFDLRGQSAGACLIRRKNGEPEIIIRYNTQAMERQDGWDHLYNDTIPHEIAHAVTYTARPGSPLRSRGHSSSWRRVCIQLGGTGKTYHNIPLEKSRKTRMWNYKLDSGKVIQLTTIRHNKIQKKGMRYRTSCNQVIARENFLGQAC